MVSNRKRMLRLAAVVVMLLCFGAVNSQAQEQKSVSALVDGQWALQFEIDRDFDLNSFEGNTFSVKKFTGGQSAWRLGVSMSVRLRDQDQTGYVDTVSNPALDYDNDAYSIAAVMHRILYSAPRSRTSFFFGFGPSFGYAYSKNATRTDDADASFALNKTKAHSWDIGLSAVIGVEWFLRRNISLLAEYGTLMQYQYEKRTSEVVLLDGSATRTRYQESKINAFVFDDQLVKVGLSVYF